MYCKNVIIRTKAQLSLVIAATVGGNDLVSLSLAWIWFTVKQVQLEVKCVTALVKTLEM